MQTHDALALARFESLMPPFLILRGGLFSVASHLLPKAISWETLGSLLSAKSFILLVSPEGVHSRAQFQTLRLSNLPKAASEVPTAYSGLSNL
jgi:hypothetical protein